MKETQSGKFHDAKMVNYSREGLYIESDSSLNDGVQVKIGIKHSPYASPPNTVGYYLGIILRRQELEHSFFQYGYGIHLIA
jgi:hypothetical protein